VKLHEDFVDEKKVAESRERAAPQDVHTRDHARDVFK
jgi:hypothetical protein